MTRTELISAPASWTHCVFQTFFFISYRNVNQLDATSKVMYRHEIICTGNTVLFADNDVTMQWLPLSGKFVNKANGVKCSTLIRI